MVLGAGSLPEGLDKILWGGRLNRESLLYMLSVVSDTHAGKGLFMVLSPAWGVSLHYIAHYLTGHGQSVCGSHRNRQPVGTIISCSLVPFGWPVLTPGLGPYDLVHH